ncbi:MAG: RNA repair domain-containing protein [Thermoprotei archaeon]
MLRRRTRSDIRDLFNRLKWDPSMRQGGRVSYVNRENGRPMLVELSFDEVTDVAKSYFRVGIGEKAKYIPYHRVVWIKCGSKLLWRSPRWRGFYD